MDTKALFEGRRVKRWVNVERPALRKLEQLEVSSRLDDLRVPPRQSAGSPGRGPGRAAQRPHERSVASVLRVARWRCARRRDRRLSLTGVHHGQASSRSGDAGRNAGSRVPQAAGSDEVPARQGDRRAPQRIGDIVAGKRAITADTDLRLCRFFGPATAGGSRCKPDTTSRSRATRWLPSSGESSDSNRSPPDFSPEGPPGAVQAGCARRASGVGAQLGRPSGAISNRAIVRQKDSLLAMTPAGLRSGGRAA